ncbi:hypothetical protein M1L60_27850 [Actinoplanes sp. TRM 88003]|uniref:Uncharacterized protein n=1 Tax=Paractinoplanes aksuensis TaxID=2939490 RepID=A0ABT1DUB8_9ACTN|nr:hypothetical protein [Actinoplanes aksuensis]MCO8274418.1 hypothetical protein [Actinoplanes aksuensis]
MSLPDAGDPGPLLDQFQAELAEAPTGVRTRIAPALAGLRRVAQGDRITGEQRLLGWTRGQPTRR